MTKNRSRPIARAAAPASLLSRVRRRSGDAADEVGKFHEYRGAFLLVTALLLAWVLKSFLLPLAAGAIFATVLNPLMARLEPRIKSRAWRAAIVTLGFVFAFLIPIGVIAILGTNAALNALHDFQSGGAALPKLSPSSVLHALGLGSFVESASSWLPASEEQIRSYALRGIEAAGLMITRALQGFVADLPGVAFANAVVVFAIYSFLSDGPRAIAFIRRNSFFSASSTDSIMATIGAVCQSTIVATLATGAVQAGLVCLACVVTGTSNALLIGLVSFIASFLPIVGTAPVTIGLAILGFAHGDATTGIIFLATIGVVGVADNLVRPLVLGGGAEMHPLVAFISAFGGLDVMGFYGLFVGPVIAGLFFAVLPVVMKSYSRASARLSSSAARKHG